MQEWHHASKSSILHNEVVSKTPPMYPSILRTIEQSGERLLSESDYYQHSDDFVFDIISSSMS